jgi:hypothetical protein
MLRDALEDRRNRIHLGGAGHQHRAGGDQRKDQGLQFHGRVHRTFRKAGSPRDEAIRNTVLPLDHPAVA